MYDMKNLAKMKKLGELAPDAFKGFMAFDEATFKSGVIPLKYKELMAVAVALTTQCPYCIEIHAKRAKKAGATEQELAETTLVTAALRGRRCDNSRDAHAGMINRLTNAKPARRHSWVKTIYFSTFERTASNLSSLVSFSDFSLSVS